MKFISSKYGPALLGSTPKQQGLVEMISQQLLDLKSSITMQCYLAGDQANITMQLLESIK